MPIFTTSVKNALLDALTVVRVSLHSAYSATGGNELIGGDPPYGRADVGFAPAAIGQRSLLASPYTLNVPAESTVAWVGMWGTLNNFMGMAPAGGSTVSPFVVDDVVLDSVKSAHHGFLVGSTLVAWAGSNGPLPGGLSEGTIYYVIGVTLDTLQLAATAGGLPVALTTTGNGFLQGIISTTYGAQDHFVLSALTLDATVAS